MTIKQAFHNRIIQLAAAAIVFFALGLLTSPAILPGNSYGLVTGSSFNLDLSSNAVQGFNSMSDIQTALQDISNKVLPSVVEVSVVDVVKQTAPQLSPFDFFFGPGQGDSAPQQREFRREGLGSGIIVRQVDNNVYVLTNNHVTSGAQEITVKFASGKQYQAALVGSDDKRDLALIRFETADRVPIAALGDSSTVQVGDWVLAVGNPLGFDSTVTEGIISAIGRKSLPNSDIAGYTDYFQTDAAINQGNSGGALVNIRGEVIGINSWIASPSGGNVGIGFAIPINNAKNAIEDFITKGKVSYGWLGVNSGDLPDASKTDLGLAGKSGSFVYGVYKNSPADNAGVLPGDFITKVNGKAITDMMQLILTAGSLKPGDQTNVELIRYGKTMDLTLQIQERPAQDSESAQASRLWPGLFVVKITDDIRNRLHIPASVGSLIISRVEPHSAADIAGMQAGDILRSINNKQLVGLMDFYKALNASGQSQIMFGLSRNSKDLLLGLVK